LYDPQKFTAEGKEGRKEGRKETCEQKGRKAQGINLK
jgi:hypothetical protein